MCSEHARDSQAAPKLLVDSAAGRNYLASLAGALPRRLTVRLRTLTPSIEVRILTGHPAPHFLCLTAVSGELHRRTIIARIVQCFDQMRQMCGIARFAFNVGDQSLGWERREHPLVIDFDDVDVLLVKNARDMIKRAGPILQPQAQPRQPA
jgi:hypothetical protein